YGVFFNLLERKVWRYNQDSKRSYRWVYRNLQPFADAIKLFCREQTYPMMSNYLIYFFLSIAETNRTPFDFSEGESELVSGFSVEYRRGGFALIFIAEYSRILFMRILTILIFLGGIYFLYYFILYWFLYHLFLFGFEIVMVDITKLIIMVLAVLIFCYFSGIWIYCSKRKHILIILLSLEYMVLFTFLLIFLLGEFQNELYFSIIYLVFAVCEGSLGLGILILLWYYDVKIYYNILVYDSSFFKMEYFDEWFSLYFLIYLLNLNGNIEGLSYILRYDLLSYGWGYQPERVQAGIYLFYTLLASLPLLIGLLKFYIVNGTLYLYGFWGDEAHVEAPISGSIVLAGLVCLRQVDLKSLIAYSSVVHIGIVLGGLMTLNS
ncbi:NADH-ubiquinone oxidoreductase chain 4, partial [Gryllus bimaculatus]